MIILGLGSNLGDRLQQFRSAISLLKKIPALVIKHISPIYISDALLPENAPESWNVPYLNFAIQCETTLTPFQLLKHTKEIEKEVGRVPGKEWGPRVIDIDILAWDDLVLYDEVLHIPHEYLHQRPFALWPLADLAPRWVYPLPGPLKGKTAAEISAAWGSRFDGNAPLHTQQIFQRVDTPALVGIINITPDSFSGSTQHPLEACQAMVTSGAEIIDVGAEASGPNAIPLDSTTEWQRLEPVLTSILHARNAMLIPPKISVDTRHADVAEKALALGVDWINDVSGLDDSTMRAVLKNHSCDIVFMHHLGIPVSQQKRTLDLHLDPVKSIYDWAQKRIAELEKSGISRERLIFDVGIGFGKVAKHSFELIQRIAEFETLGVRLLVGHSRKSFLKLFTTRAASERDIETLAVTDFLATQPVDYLRVHNVGANGRMLRVLKAFK
jgi:2-amino-4-hydroxy-6-hydroxymethyldihydropteridine diphosphokinase/dihydropteroate synthase